MPHKRKRATFTRSRNVDERAFRKIAQLPSWGIHNHSARSLGRNENTEEGLDGNGDDPVPGYGRYDFDRHRS
jgi:hypothetical protein